MTNIVNFLKNGHQIFVFGVIVVVLLTSAVGVVSSEELGESEISDPGQDADESETPPVYNCEEYCRLMPEHYYHYFGSSVLLNQKRCEDYCARSLQYCLMQFEEKGVKGVNLIGLEVGTYPATCLCEDEKGRRVHCFYPCVFWKEDCPACTKLSMELYTSEVTSWPYETINGQELRCEYGSKWGGTAKGKVIAFKTAEEAEEYHKDMIRGLMKQVGDHWEALYDLDGYVITGRLYAGEVPITYKTRGSALYNEKYVIWVEAEYKKDQDTTKKSFYELRECLKAVIDEAEEKEEKALFALKHYSTFEMGEPDRGEIRATLIDKDGNGIPHKNVFFYVEPGTNLASALKFSYTPPGNWVRLYGNGDLKNANQDSYLGERWTTDKGLAAADYIEYNYIRPDAFSKALIKDGKVQGIVRAVVVDESLNVEYEASIPVTFTSVAKIVSIWGEGLPDSVSGPGKVRVKRTLAQPHFDYKQVPVGFELMPGDIINIDANANVEILWIDGTRVIARVPRKVGTTELLRSNIVILSSAFDSGFPTDLEKVTTKLFGFAVGKGVDFAIESVPYVGKTAKFSLDMYKSLKDVDLNKVDLVTKIRVRSKMVVDQEEDLINVYNIEGSPDLETVKGEEMTLKNKEVVTISDDGSIVKIESFDSEKIEKEFFETIPSTTPTLPQPLTKFSGLTFESRSKPTGSSVQIPLTLNGIEDKIGNMDMTLDYDPSILEATGVIKGGLTAGCIFDYNIPDEGTIKISLADSEGLSGDGSIAYVNFNVIGVEGSSSPLQIAAMMANKADDYEELDIQTNDGEFRVISIEEGMGDGDGDGEYTALDALYALQMAVGKIPEDLTMDVNGDGKVSSIDARKILRIAAGLEELT